jgi:hypothetical protein
MDYIDKALLDYLKNKNNPDKIKYDSSMKLTKVAFDIYKINNGKKIKDHYEGLWKLDGDYLIRASDPRFNSNEGGDWSATSSYDNSHVVLAYKSIPIANFRADEFGFESEDISLFKEALLERTGSDNEFTSDVLRVQAKDKCKALVITFPELKKYLEG